MSRPVIYGEVLFDEFSDGQRVLGGAPFNVAWNLRSFGLDPLFISRIGNDFMGEQVIDAMKQWGMDVQFIQKDYSYGTGRVQVDLIEGQPVFNILPQQAYDFIDPKLFMNELSVMDLSLLYHGSLIARYDSSFHLLKQTVENLNLPSFVDINLRSPWWSQSCIEYIIQKSKWCKMNRDELFNFCGNDIISDDELLSNGFEVLKKYSLDVLIVTMGEEGAIFFHDHSFIKQDSNNINQFIDTVGAGDGFASVFIYGLIKGWEYPIVLERAVEFASRICTIRGAVTEEREFYSNVIKKWDECDG